MFWKDRDERNWKTFTNASAQDIEQSPLVDKGLDRLRQRKEYGQHLYDSNDALLKELRPSGSEPADNGDSTSAAAAPLPKEFLKLRDIRWCELAFYSTDAKSPNGTAEDSIEVIGKAADDTPINGTGNASSASTGRKNTPILLELQFTDPSRQRNTGGNQKDWPDDRVCAYFIVSDSRDVSDSKDDDGMSEADLTHLDGTSPPIHEFNARHDGINLTYAVDYCDFFCAFVAGEEGSFNIVRNFEDLQWPVDRQARTAISELKKRLYHDIGEHDKAKEAEGQETIEQIANEIKNNKKGHSYDVTRKPEQEPEDNDETRCYELTVQYSSALFRADMKIQKSGMIEMSDDQPVFKQFFPLPIDRWNFEQFGTLSNDRLLVLKPHLTDDEVRQKLLEAKRPLAPVYTLSNFVKLQQKESEDDAARDRGRSEDWIYALPDREIGPGIVKIQEFRRLRGSELTRRIVVDGVTFFGTVDLMDLQSSKGLEFRNCNFIGKFDARNARIGSNLTFENCNFYGLPQISDQQQTDTSTGELIAANLDGIHVGGDLRFERVRVYGHLTVRSARVTGRGLFRGLSFLPISGALLEEFDDKPNGHLKVSRRQRQIKARDFGGIYLDVRHSRFGAGLEFSASFPIAPPSPGALQRTADQELHPFLIVGGIRADQIQVEGTIVVCGVITANLNDELFGSEAHWLHGWKGISFENARVDGNVQMWSPGDSPNEGFRVVRSVVLGDISLTQSRVDGSVYLRGTFISGNLNCSLLNCTGHFSVGALKQEQIDNYTNNFLDCEFPKARDKPLLTLPSTLMRQQTRNQNETIYRLTRYGRTCVGDSINLKGAVIGGDVYFCGTFIGEDILLDRGRYGSISCAPHLSRIAISADKGTDYLAAIGEDDEMGGGALAELIGKQRDHTILLHLDKRDDEKQKEHKGLLLQQCEASRLTLQDTTVNGTVNLTGLCLATMPPQQDQQRADAEKVWPRELDKCGELFEACSCQANGAITFNLPDRKRPRLEIENSNILGNLLLFDKGAYFTTSRGIQSDLTNGFWSEVAGSTGASQRQQIERYLRENIPLKWLRLRSTSDISIKNSNIDGEVDLSGIQVLGSVSVRDVNLTSDLLAEFYPSDKAVADPAVNLNVISETGTPCYALMCQLDLEMLRCDGDVLVPALHTYHLDYEQGSRGGLTRDSGINAHNVIIKGQLLLTDNQMQGGTAPTPQSAKISGKANFTGLEVADITLAGCQDEVTLERARIGSLNIQSAPAGRKFPAIDFRGAHFDRITIDENDDAKKAVQFFKESRPKDRPEARPKDRPNTEVATRAERILRAQGRRADANTLYKFAQKEWISKHQPRIARFFYWIWYYVAGFGVTSWVLLGLCLLLTVSALLLTGAPQNWVAASVANGRPVPIERRIFKAIEISVPLIRPLSSTTRYELKSAGPTQFSVMVPLASWQAAASTAVGIDVNQPWPDLRLDWRSALAPTTVASIIHLLGWVLWPAYLLVLSGFMRREP